MKRSVLNLLGGLLLCLPMLFTSCSEKDNSLEQIVNQPNLEGLQKALYTNAEVTVQYTVYGKTDPYTVTLKNVGTVEKPKYELQGEMPTDLGYKLTCDMGYVDDNLYFGLVYNKKVTDECDESEDMFDLAPVMVVKFDTKTSKYDVYALPGFDFKVISINGANIDVTEASADKAYIEFDHYGTAPAPAGTRSADPTSPTFAVGGLSGCPMEINLNGVNNWEELDNAYDEVGLGVFASISDKDGDDNDETGNMIIDLSDYDFYFTAPADANYWKVFVIYEGTTVQKKTSEVAVEKTYTAIDYANTVYLPCYGLNSKGNIALLDVLKLQLPDDTHDGSDNKAQWTEIAEVNPGYIKVVRNKTSGKLTIVTIDGVVNDNGKKYYYSLYDGKSSYRVSAEADYDKSLNYHFYQLKSSIRDNDEDVPLTGIME